MQLTFFWVSLDISSNIKFAFCEIKRFGIKFCNRHALNFFFFIAVYRTSRKTLHRSGDNVHHAMRLHVFLSLEGSSHSFIIKYKVRIRFFKDAYHQNGKFPNFPCCISDSPYELLNFVMSLLYQQFSINAFSHLFYCYDK